MGPHGSPVEAKKLTICRLCSHERTCVQRQISNAITLVNSSKHLNISNMGTFVLRNSNSPVLARKLPFSIQVSGLPFSRNDLRSFAKLTTFSNHTALSVQFCFVWPIKFTCISILLVPSLDICGACSHSSSQIYCQLPKE